MFPTYWYIYVPRGALLTDVVVQTCHYAILMQSEKMATVVQEKPQSSNGSEHVNCAMLRLIILNHCLFIQFCTFYQLFLCACLAFKCCNQIKANCSFFE